VRWQQPAIAVGRLIRACTPAPGAWTELDGGRVKLGPVRPAAPGEEPLAPGELRLLRGRVLAGTGTAPVELGDVQADGKRTMTAADWARGLRLAGRAAVLG
jgi:methionyl-tRNA formyltransferase